MRRTLIAAGLIALVIAGAAGARFAHADGLDAAALPSDTRWVIHVDIDAGRTTPLWQLARNRILEARREEIAPRIKMLEQVTGLALPQGLHDVTLFGSAYDPTAVCIRIHGDFDEQRTTGFLKGDPEFRSEDYNGHTLLTWRDREKDRLMYGAFAGNGGAAGTHRGGEAATPTTARVALLSPSRRELEAALDTLDGKAPALKADSPLVPAAGTDGHPNPAIFWMAGINIADLAQLHVAESPALSQMEAASVGIDWGNESATLRVRINTKTDKAALQMQALAEGAKATLALAAADEHATPKTRLLSAALQEFMVTADKSTVKGEWSLGIDKIESLADVLKPDTVLPRRAAATGARGGE